jgi:hypothetical protein
MATDVRIWDGTQWVSIKGPDGAKGDPGTAATVAVGTVGASANGTQPTVTNAGTANAAVLNFTIPGGAPGQAATVQVGTTATGLPGTQAQVTNVGTTAAATLNFTIPKGDKGDAGSGVTIKGETLVYPPMGTHAAGDMFILGAGATAGAPPSSSGPAQVGDGVVYNGTGWTNVGPIRGPQGSSGSPGTAATVGVGTVTGLAAGSAPTVTNTGTAQAAVLAFGLPAGAKGDTGTPGDSQQFFSQAGTPTGPRPGAIWLVS